MPVAKSPPFDTAALLSRTGTEILGQPCHARWRDELRSTATGPDSFKRELLAFVYAVLGLVFVSDVPDCALGSLARIELEPQLRGSAGQGDASANTSRHLARLLAVARLGSADEGIVPHGGIFDATLFSHFVETDGSLLIPDSTVHTLVQSVAQLTRSSSSSPRARLGELYESLLELEPSFRSERGELQFLLQQVSKQHARRRLGSYYTPEPLIAEILDRALDPLIHKATSQGKPEDLLRLRLIDPACGAGDFLSAAALRIARSLAQLERHPEPSRKTTERVLTSCIFGVDVDPLAREICRLGLWLDVAGSTTGLTPGALPIRVGSSILIPPKLAEPPARQGHLVYFDWHAEFPEVMRSGGFDAIVGNPPWIAHAGRAAQPLSTELRGYYERHAESFAGYPTTHGIFAGVLPSMLRTGGRLGLVLPTSVSELDGYSATRRAHDRYNHIPEELVDFGEGRFARVTQPCMALISERRENGRGSQAGAAWPVARPDLSANERGLLEKLCTFDVFPKELFGERGLQSDRSLLGHLKESNTPVDRFVVPLREGSDVREFSLRPPRMHADPVALGKRLRSPAEFQSVRFLVRQTARFPVAALSDGVGFRNSILAGFELPGWPATALVPLLNSTLVRWIHFQRYRDARQPILPQVKIGHLRRLPAPRTPLSDCSEALAGFTHAALRRRELDEFVFQLYDLTIPERSAVERWRDRMLERSAP